MKRQCELCEKPLTGGTDTFGWPGDMCWNCYAEMNSHGDGELWYGLGPHHHDLEITGSIIGSTVLEPLPKPNAQGEYEIDGCLFLPDPEAAGLGTWTRKPMLGWR